MFHQMKSGGELSQVDKIKGLTNDFMIFNGLVEKF